ncbi:MAG: EF-P 5-aminopentanol modification-associated protein YfmF [Filifactoraceae bacterium]
MEKLKINDRVRLLYLPNPHLKVATISLYFRRPLSREEVTLNSLIPDVLKCGTERLKTEKDIDKELQALYGANVAFNTIKVGEKQILAFKMLMCADKYLPEPVLEKGMSLLREIIYNPYIVDGGFSNEYTEREKEVLKEDILGKINNKGSYAIDRCIVNMCENEAFSISDDGYIEDLGEINGINLYNHYKTVVSSSPVDIVVVGDVDFNNLKEIIERDFVPESNELSIIPEDNIISEVESVRYISESLDVSQGKLVMGYRTGITARDKNYYDLFLYSAVLGTGVSSKLFRNVREKHSLCYSIGSNLEKFKGLMFISAGIEVSNYEFALKLIKEQVEDMKIGNISDEELDSTKKYLINNMRSIKDSPVALGDFYFSQSLQNGNDDIDSVIEKIKNVSKEGIIKVAKNIKLDTVYFLTNQEVSNENN